MNAIRLFYVVRTQIGGGLGAESRSLIGPWEECEDAETAMQSLRQAAELGAKDKLLNSTYPLYRIEERVGFAMGADVVVLPGEFTLVSWEQIEKARETAAKQREEATE